MLKIILLKNIKSIKNMFFFFLLDLNFKEKLVKFFTFLVIVCLIKWEVLIDIFGILYQNYYDQLTNFVLGGDLKPKVNNNSEIDPDDTSKDPSTKNEKDQKKEMNEKNEKDQKKEMNEKNEKDQKKEKSSQKDQMNEKKKKHINKNVYKAMYGKEKSSQQIDFEKGKKIGEEAIKWSKKNKK